MLKHSLPVNMNNEGLAVSFIWKDPFAQSFSWNTSLSLSVILNNLLKDFQYLPLVKSCHPILTAVSNPKPHLVTDAMHFSWIGLKYRCKYDYALGGNKLSLNLSEVHLIVNLEHKPFKAKFKQH